MLIFSWGSKDPDSSTNNDIFYHGYNQRGSRSVVLVSSMTQTGPAPLPSDLEQIRFVVANTILPNDDTVYYNEFKKLPDLIAKKHVVKVKTTIIVHLTQIFSLKCYFH